MTSTTERVRARDGTDRLVRRWAPAGEPWAHVLPLHGLGEHSGRYEAVGARLAGAGVAVQAHDHAGFGASDGARGDSRAGPCSTTTSRIGWRRSGSRRAAGRSCCTGTRWVGSWRWATC